MFVLGILFFMIVPILGKDDDKSLTMHVRNAINTISKAGFICACAKMREDNNRYYVRATKFYKDNHNGEESKVCVETWHYYILNSKDEICVKVREFYKNEHDEQNHYLRLSKALCRSYVKCSAHLHCDKNTVKVIEKITTTTAGIREVLRFEQDNYLLTSSELSYINLFLLLLKEKPYRFKTFRREGHEYAIPQIGNVATLVESLKRYRCET
ncbi:uncharacterized protein LOC135838926 [Planococcus citri]|uniref:uncharacterized protein LOC135838926 n=1 Tax=Planococcus citri TaxID=170843 RepID=UPI0031F8C252